MARVPSYIEFILEYAGDVRLASEYLTDDDTDDDSEGDDGHENGQDGSFSSISIFISTIAILFL